MNKIDRYVENSKKLPKLVDCWKSTRYTSDGWRIVTRSNTLVVEYLPSGK